MSNRFSGIFLFVLAGVATAGGFLAGPTWLSAFFGWLAVIALARGVSESEKCLRGLFVYGVLLHALGFYWLPHTVTAFGGFPLALALLVFALFCATSSVQYVLVGVLYRRLRRTALDRAALALPFSWLALDMIFPQIFPWRYAHTQIAWQSFAGLAESVGVTTLTALLLWWGALLTQAGLSLRIRGLLALGIVALVVFGARQNAVTRDEIAAAPKVKGALIQGNLSTEHKGNVDYLEVNLDTYRRLSDDAVRAGARMLFWPETVVNEWTPENIRTVRGAEIDPYPAGTTPLVYGTLSFRRRPEQEFQALLSTLGAYLEEGEKRALAYAKFNSAFGIDGSGNVRGAYHKRILMPFGEYLPFARSFPALLALSPQTGDFDAGDLKEPIRFDSPAVAVAPLICYEDLLPGPSREGVERGANLLLNLTNDAWYGASHAPFQHHMIALWRAIETRRTLVRATNTGFTAVVTPLGETLIGPPLFQEGVLIAELPLLSRETLSVKLAERQNWLIVAVVIAFLPFGAPRFARSD